MKSLLIYSVFFVSYVSLSIAQNESGRSDEFCSITFVNASPVESLEFRVEDRIWYPKFISGQKTGAGRIPRLNWPVEIRSSDSGEVFSLDFQAENGKSYIAVILGDFQKIIIRNENGEESEKLRADVKIYSANFTADERPNRVRIINGMVETPVAVPIAGGQTRILGFGEHQVTDRLGANDKITVLVGDEMKELSFLFVPPETGSTVVFYDGETSPQMTVVNEVVILPDGTYPIPEPEEVERVLQQSEIVEE